MRSKLIVILFGLFSSCIHAQENKANANHFLKQFLEVEFIDTVAMRISTDSALHYAMSAKDDYLIGMALRYKGWYYQDLANYQLALKMFDESLAVFQKLKNDQQIADAHGNIGTVFMDLKMHIQALKHQLRSLEINKLIISHEPDSLVRLKALNGIGACLSNLSTIFNDLGEVEKAIEYQHQSIYYEKLKEGNNDIGIAISYHSLAISHRTLNQLDSAQMYIDLALELYSKHDNVLGMSQANIQKGRIYDALELYDEAEIFLQKGYALAMKTGNQKDIAIGASNLTALYIRMQKPEQALKYLVEITKINAFQNDLNNQHNLYILKSDYYDLIGKPDSALFYYKRGIDLRDSIFSRDKDKQIIYDQYEFQLREASIKDSIAHKTELEKEQIKLENANARAHSDRMKRNYLLTGTALLSVLAVILLLLSRSRKRINAKLNQSLNERDILLKEIHHRVKNNLQIVSSLLSLQSQGTEGKSAKEILIMSQNRIQSMALIHEKLYQSDTLSEINFKEYIEHLIEHISQSFGLKEKEIQIRITGEDLAMDIDRLVPCGLIINELITNSVKHAFEETQQGLITVESKKNGDQCTILIRDNGIGLPENFNLNQSRSLGMRLASGLCKQLKSDLKFESVNGTTFSFTFSLPQN